MVGDTGHVVRHATYVMAAARYKALLEAVHPR